jgi:tetraacyldisaccharide 4'-kinase
MAWEGSFSRRLQREWLDGGPLSIALLPLSGLYAALLALRRLAYAWGWKRVETLPVPVIVVGNWIVGGAGKTPTTLALLAHLKQLGVRVGVVSRGYGRADDATQLVSATTPASLVGDEPLLIHLRAGVPVAVGRDRVAAARALLAAHPTIQLLVSDDGLQHWRLPRALSVLVFDERGIGNGRLLPAGPLREAPAWRDDAARLVVYNAPAASTPLAGHVAQRRLAGALSLADWWAGRTPDPNALQALRGGQSLLAAAGLARPQRFFDMLMSLGIPFTPLPLPDHHGFTTLPWPDTCAGVVVTEKDAVKLDPKRVGGVPVWVVALDFQFDPVFGTALDAHLRRLLA